MNKHNVSMGLLVATLAGASACTIDESLDYTEFRTTGFGCTQCGMGGSNSAHVNLYPVDSIHLNGQANDGGLVLVGVRSLTNTMFILNTEGDELIAQTTGGAIVASGAGLVGWTIVLRDGNEPVEINISGYDTFPSWAAGGTPVSGYALTYHDANAPSELRNVCPDYINDPDRIASTILRGELYDEGTKELASAPEWITIACFGNALAKMKMMNYSRFADFDTHDNPATQEQRQATIRMITADYCGDGSSFTEDGTPLNWENAQGAITPEDPQSVGWGTFEAIWDEYGARCLLTPRLSTVTLEDVQSQCDIPECDPQWLAENYEWLTWLRP